MNNNIRISNQNNVRQISNIARGLHYVTENWDKFINCNIPSKQIWKNPYHRKVDLKPICGSLLAHYKCNRHCQHYFMYHLMNFYAKAEHFGIDLRNIEKKERKMENIRKTSAVSSVVLFGFCFPSNTTVNKFLICGFRKTNRNKVQLHFKTLTDVDVLITWWITW